MATLWERKARIADFLLQESGGYLLIETGEKIFLNYIQDYTERTKPSTSFTERSKPTTSWTERIK